MARWTLKDIPDLKGKIIIVTGGNSGLGFESVKAFSQHGATVIIACRSKEKGELAKAKIGVVPGQIMVMSLDLSQPDSIAAFTKAYVKIYSRLDVLMNNAGVMRRPYALSVLGVESQLSTNHLGHFMLTSRLLNLIGNTPQSRVVNVSSLAHVGGGFNFQDINYDDGKDYDPMEAYRRSKLANLYFTYALDRYFKANGINAISVAAHPGVAPTNLMNHAVPVFFQWLIRPLARLFLQPVKVGVLCQIRAAVDTHVEGADFYGPSGKDEWRGSPVLVKSTPASHDEMSAQQLWRFSEEVTGCQFIVKKD